MPRQPQQKNIGDYIQAFSPKGYVSNREITNLDGQYLVKNSKNCLVVNKEKVVGSKGYTLLGDAKTLDKGVKSHFDWDTSSGIRRSLRGYDDELEVWYLDEWMRLKNGWRDTTFEFTTWWDDTEQIDKLLFVDGSDIVYEWSGAITKVASVTADTITKKYYLSGTGIAFNDNGASPDTITDSNNGFVTAGFAIGDEIVVVGSSSNDGVYTISTVTAGVITLISADTLDTEASGASIVVKKKNYGSWAEERFLVGGTRKVVISGVEYTYTGGETTGTLTGVTPSPVGNSVAANDIVMQAVRSNTVSEFSDMTIDLIAMKNNHVCYASTTSRKFFVSKNTDFDNFAYTALRVPGEGFDGNLDSRPTNIVVGEGDVTFWFSGGRDEWYKLSMVLSDGQAAEAIVVNKLKTSPGQSAVRGGIFYVKNAVAFLSHEPTVDTLGNIEQVIGEKTVPISDDIRDDLEKYNTLNVQGLYVNRELWITLPAEGLVLIYDFQNKHWQPPQELALSRLALIEVDGKIKLCGHSSVCNETYILNDGYNHNGASYPIVMAFGYDNFGSRFNYKNFDELAVEMYISDNTVVTDRVIYDYKGATDVRDFTIDTNDSNFLFRPRLTDPSLGKAPLGSRPLGSLSETPDDLIKLRIIHTTQVIDFIERQRVFIADGIDSRFEIIAYGENAEQSENIPTFIK